MSELEQATNDATEDDGVIYSANLTRDTAEPPPDDQDGDEGESSPEVDPEDAAWDDDAAETEDDDEDDDLGQEQGHQVPISRLKKEKAKRVAERTEKERIAAENATLRAELDAFKAGKEPNKPTAPVTPGSDDDQIEKYVRANDPEVARLEAIAEAINPDDFETMGEYARAVAKANRAADSRLLAGVTTVRADIAQRTRQQQAETQGATQASIDRYVATLQKSTIPDIEKYATRISTKIERLHPMIQQAIVDFGDEADLVTAALGSNRDTFDYFANASKVKVVSPAVLARLGVEAEKFRAKVTATKRPEPEDAPKPRPAVNEVRRRPAPDTGSSRDSDGVFRLSDRDREEMRKSRYR